jgi:hypothetical protein
MAQALGLWIQDPCNALLYVHPIGRFILKIEKHLLDSSCLAVRPSVRGCHWTNYPRYLMLGSFKKIFRETPNLVKIGQKYRALYMKT